MIKSDIAGVILAGGKSSRFGSNKALAEFKNRRLIEYPAKALEKVFANRLLITNSPDDYKFLGWPMAEDIFPGKGPLAGIHAALKNLSAPYIFVTGCDMPFPSISLISHLSELAPGYDAVIPTSHFGLEPLHAIYARTALSFIEKCLQTNVYKIHDVLSQMNIRKIEPDEVNNIVDSGEPFKNINTFADLDELEG